MAAPKIVTGQLRLILAISLVYLVAWYAYLGQVPLGLFPTALEESTMETAFALAQSRLPDAATVTIYERILALPAYFVGSRDGLVASARLINALALVLAAAVCARAAGKFWKKNRAIWIAGLLIGLNPVLLFWSVEVSPTLLAVLCSALSFSLLLRWLRYPSLRKSLLMGLYLALGLGFDTNFLFFLLLWPAIACFYPGEKRVYHLGASLIFPALALLLFSVSSLQLQSTPSFDLSHLGKNIYEVFNSYETHDGKSYGLHKELNIFLLLNPLHWGLIFMLALCGAYIRVKHGHQGQSIIALFLCLGLFALSYALNDGGSKARALLYPLITIFAGGSFKILQIWKRAGKPTKRTIMAGLLFTAGICYSDLYNARSEQHRETDYRFLARANLALERNKSARKWAEKAIELNPGSTDMRSIVLIASLRDWALSPIPSALARENAVYYLDAARNANLQDPETRAIEALYLFKLRQTDEAYEIWKDIHQQSALALICLYWTGQVEKPNDSVMDDYPQSPFRELLQISLQINRNALAYSEHERTLDNLLAFAH